MAEVNQGLRTLQTSSPSLSIGDSNNWCDTTCPHCGAARMVKVAQVVNSSNTFSDDFARWLRCPGCLGPAVQFRRAVYPARIPFREPAGLPEVDARIWSEARTCLGVGAYAAAVMLCRKLLFHIAVAQGLPPKNDKDRAPSFVEAVQKLESEGVITGKMRPWVDRIKDVGNDANHELSPISKEEALDVATFTMQLLILAYELDALMGDPSAAEVAVD